MNVFQGRDDSDALVALPEDVPVVMPELPLCLIIDTQPQFKAVSDPVRSRILGIIQHRPATAKQIADQLGLTPGAIGHHLHVLETAGLAQVVAKRVIRGIIANYYTRTARIFEFKFPSEITGEQLMTLHFVARMRDDISEALAERGESAVYTTSHPRMRLSPERAKVYSQRLQDLVSDFIAEEPDPQGQVYSLFTTLYMAPRYLQGQEAPLPEDPQLEEGE